jgi:hypothetical protein
MGAWWCESAPKVHTAADPELLVKKMRDRLLAITYGRRSQPVRLGQAAEWQLDTRLETSPSQDGTG